MQPTSGGAPFNVLARSGSNVLSEDDDGLALWSTDNDEPIAVFPLDGAGRARAFASFRAESRFARWWSVALITSVIAGLAWIVSEVTSQALRSAGIDSWNPFEGDATPLSWKVHAWVDAFGGVAYAVFVVAVSLSVLLWLQRRSAREAWQTR